MRTTIHNDRTVTMHLPCMVPLILALGCPSVGLAQPEPPPRDIDRLLQLDFAELIDTKVKLASRAEESAFATPAAVYVISAEDIRRSGHRRLAELLRLVPGLHVGKIDGDHWAVSSRNAQNRFSSTMLVMIDGRHIYTPLYGGVRWELQDTLLQDIDHIEVIRGPGGPLWGANAVDGIINIVTKHARDTHGTLLYAAAGDGEMNTDAGGRYGGVTDGGVNYRAYAKDYHSDNGAYLNADQSTHNGLRTPGEDAYDRENASQVGFRADWNANARDSLMLQANAYDNHIDEERSLSAGVFPNSADAQGVNSMLHWTRRLDSGNSLELNASLDQVRFSDDILNETQTLGDLDFQHLINRGPQQFIWGLGYRYYHNDVTIPDPTACDFTQPCFTLDPPKRTDNTLSAFVQDRVQTSAETAVIVGTKLEHNDYTDFEYQPTLRLLWTPTDDASLWTAVTRAVRTPTRTGSDGQLDFGSGVTVPIGNPDAEAWQVYAYEVGYRQRLSQRLNFDLAAFNDDYRNTLQPPLASPTSRGLDKVYGLEAVVRLQPLPRWRLETSYTLHRGQDDTASGATADTLRLPEHSANLRSYLNLDHDLEFDTLLYYADGQTRTTDADLPSYTRLDLRLGWHPRQSLETSLWLTNLLDDIHPEQIEALKINTGVRRGLLLTITLRYE